MIRLEKKNNQQIISTWVKTFVQYNIEFPPISVLVILRYFFVVVPIVDIYCFDLFRLFSQSIYTVLSINQSRRIGGFPVVNIGVFTCQICVISYVTHLLLNE